MLKHVFDYISRRKRKTALAELCKALDKEVQRCDPDDEVFLRITNWMIDSGLSLLHLVVMKKRDRTAVDDARIKQMGWIFLGKVADATSAKVIRLGRHWNEAWSHEDHAFVHQQWVGQVAWGGEPVPVHVCARSQDWWVLEDLEEDGMEQVETHWATITAVPFVDFAYLQVLPDGQTQGGVSVDPYPATT